ncbi:hypothetical protein MKX07_003679 [Trichoderma sp. CBMAI-0711]|nr:hypothetical protein MKX07_003679 [Trichoderma sp. CBMAI-0711]
MKRRSSSVDVGGNTSLKLQDPDAEPEDRLNGLVSRHSSTLDRQLSGLYSNPNQANGHQQHPPSHAAIASFSPLSLPTPSPSMTTTKQPPSAASGARGRGLWFLSILCFLVATAGVGLLIAIFRSLTTRQIEPKGCRMSYMRPSYIHFSEFDTEHTRFASKYSLYLYREQGIDGGQLTLHGNKLRGIPVLFIPGNAGSYKQVRPIAAETANYFHDYLQHDRSQLESGIRSLDFFTVDFNEDITAFHGQTLLDQAEYLNEAVRYILSLYTEPQRVSRDSHLPDPTSVLILGHSMGGVVARAMLVQPNYQENSINTIITMSAPHARPPVTFDSRIVQIYDEINDYWRRAYTQKWASNNPLWHVTLVSIAGGNLDTVVPSDYASIESLVPETHGFTVFTSGIPTVWTSMDHQAILWCDQFRRVLAQTLYDIVDVHRASQTKPRAQRMRVFKRRLLTGLEPIAEKTLSLSEPTILLTLDDSSSTVVPTGVRLVLSQLGSEAAPRAYLLPVPPHGSLEPKRFTLLTDAQLNTPVDGNQLQVLLCSVASVSPILSSTIDLSRNGTTPTRPYESKFFVNARTTGISFHGVAPYMPPPLASSGADGLAFGIWSDPTCRAPLEIDLYVDVLGSLGKLYMRYRTVFAAFPLLIVTLVLRKQFRVYDTTGTFISFSEGLDLSLRQSIPLLLSGLTLLSLSPSRVTTFLAALVESNQANPNLFSNISFHKNDLLIGTDDPLFIYLVPFIGIILTVVRALRIYVVTPSAANSNYYHYSHSILLLMMWVLPINLPILAVWVRNLAVHWLTPFSSHHNVLSIMPFILLVENLTTGKMVPQITCGFRHITSGLLFGTALCAAIYGVSRAYMLHYLVNVVAGWLVILHSSAEPWSLMNFASWLRWILGMGERRKLGDVALDIVLFAGMMTAGLYVARTFLNPILSNLVDPDKEKHEQAKRQAKAHLDRLSRRRHIDGMGDNGADGARGGSRVEELVLNEYENLIALEMVAPDDIHVGFDGEFQQSDSAMETTSPLIGPSLLSAPSGVLLYGPPGCGKTMLAKALAKESGASFINLHISTLTEKWYGDSNKIVRAVFSLARKMQPAIVFIDEIDAVLGTRRSGEHEASGMVKAEFMTLWDGLTSSNSSGVPAQIVVLGATNRIHDIDEAILRRMPKKFPITLPNLEQRRRILQLILKDAKVDAEHFDLDHVAKITAGMSGSDIKEACRDAAMAPVREYMRQHGRDGSKRPVDPAQFRGIRTDDFLKHPGDQYLLEVLQQRQKGSGQAPASDAYADIDETFIEPQD